MRAQQLHYRFWTHKLQSLEDKLVISTEIKALFSTFRKLLCQISGANSAIFISK